MTARNVAQRKEGPGLIPEPLPLYSAVIDSPTLGNGKTGPNASSANPAAYSQASRNEPRASNLLSVTGGRPAPGR